MEQGQGYSYHVYFSSSNSQNFLTTALENYLACLLRTASATYLHADKIDSFVCSCSEKLLWLAV